MKSFKKGIATILILSMIFCSNGFAVLAESIDTNFDEAMSELVTESIFDLDELTILLDLTTNQ